MSGRKFTHIEKELMHQDQHITDLGRKMRQGDETDLLKKQVSNLPGELSFVTKSQVVHRPIISACDNPYMIEKHTTLNNKQRKIMAQRREKPRSATTTARSFLKAAQQQVSRNGLREEDVTAAEKRKEKQAQAYIEKQGVFFKEHLVPILDQPSALPTYDSMMIIMDDYVDDIRFSARVVRMDKMEPGSKFDKLTIPVVADIDQLKAEIGKFVADVAPDRVAELGANKKATARKAAPKP